MTNSKISPELIKAYQETRYHIFRMIGDISLKIGEKNESLSVYGNCAFITPSNPLGVIRRDGWNTAMLKNFTTMLALHEYDFLYATGQHPETKNHEEGLFVCNISREEAISYGKWYRQNAIVFCENCVPELILLR